MEEAPESGKESSRSAHANGINEWVISTDPMSIMDKLYSYLRRKLLKTRIPNEVTERTEQHVSTCCKVTQT